MDKNSILEFNNKESVSDVLNELLRSGAQKLIHNAVEAELREFMSQHQRSYRRWKGFSYTKWLPAKTRDSDGYWSSQCTYSQGTLERWRGTNFSFRLTSEKRDPWKQHYLGSTSKVYLPEKWERH